MATDETTPRPTGARPTVRAVVDDLLNQRQAAERAGVPQPTVNGWVRRGELPVVLVAGRMAIAAADLDTFLAARAPIKRRRKRHWWRDAA